MTTIAFDGTRLATDSQSTNCNRYMVVRKLHIINGKILAATGDSRYSMPAVEWLTNMFNGGAAAELQTKPSFPEAASFDIVVVYREGDKTVCDLYGPELCARRVLQPFIAFGSGGEFAMAAMHCGKSAMQAVAIATKYDVYSCGPVQMADPRYPTHIVESEEVNGCEVVRN